jgi:hypothetical protein
VLNAITVVGAEKQHFVCRRSDRGDVGIDNLN